MPLVAIVGRPNVGKSTFYNRLTEVREAIVHDEPGVTRDRVYGDAEWNGVAFDVVDTGGLVPSSADRFEAAIREQVHIAIEETDVLLFVVDVTTGITDLDQQIAGQLRSIDKPVLVVANKADNATLRWSAADFYGLGVGEVYPISAVNGTGTGELLDALVKVLPENPPDDTPDDAVRVAFIGRPNVGKSSLTNALLGQERSIVTEVSGTTRDAVDATLQYKDRPVVLVDTAGLRRKSRISENIEFYALLRTERAIQGCDVAVLLLDASAGLEAQDIKVLKKAESMKKGMVIAVNKWDLLDKETNTARDFARGIQERLRTLDYIPILFISALTKQRIHRVLDVALEVAERRSARIPTSRLNDVMLAAVAERHPPSYRGNHIKIKYVAQVREGVPVFAFFCNHPAGIKESYRRYLEKKIRTHFGFEGVPLTLVFKAK